MRILMVIEQMYLGGLETHVVTLCRQLISHHHTVYVYLAHSVGPWRKILADCGACLVNSPREAAALDLIHLHVWGETALQALTWSKELQIPLVATYHGTYDFYLRELLEKAEFICASRTVRDFLGITATVIENGIDLDWFTSSSLPLNHTVAWLGRLDGIRWLTLEAIFQACAMTQLKCKVAGVFLPPRAVELLCKYPHVEWYGAVFDAASFIKKVDIVISTSRGIREAMASGRVAIVANNMWYGGIVNPTTVLKLRRNSFMAWQDGPLLPTVLAGDLSGLYQDPAAMEKLGQWSADYARREFSAEMMVSATEAVYRRAVEADNKSIERGFRT